MPKFEVIKSVDAYVRYGTVVEAETAEEAHQIACSEYFNGEWKHRWVDEFDTEDIFPEDVSELTNKEVETIYG